MRNKFWITNARIIVITVKTNRKRTKEQVINPFFDFRNIKLISFHLRHFIWAYNMYIDTHPRQILEDLKDISNLASAFIRDIERLEEEKNLKMLDIKIK